MGTPASLPFAAAADGVRIRVRVQPRARRNRIEGLVVEADGGVALKLAVTAAPAAGAANAAVLALLAETWGVARSALDIAAGASGRRKTIALSGEPRQRLRSFEEWFAKFGTST